MATWRELIKDTLDGDSLIECTLTDEELDVEFDDSYGIYEGKPFTAWSKEYVYFPVGYDGSESVGRAPRNPRNEICEHFGGGG